MQLSFWTTLLVGLAVAAPTSQKRNSCTAAQRIAAVKAEIATIRSHTAADAAKIPLTETASRTFFVTYVNSRSPRFAILTVSGRPDEANAVAVPVNVGVTAETVRSELVVLATALNAGVPEGSDHYTVNPNNTVTVDYIQTNRIALPRVNVREIHSIDTSTCQISKIVGYVHGPLTAVTAGLIQPGN